MEKLAWCDVPESEGWKDKFCSGWRPCGHLLFLIDRNHIPKRKRISDNWNPLFSIASQMDEFVLNWYYLKTNCLDANRLKRKSWLSFVVTFCKLVVNHRDKLAQKPTTSKCSFNNAYQSRAGLYGCIFLSLTSKMNYVSMQNDHVQMRLTCICVSMQNNHADMQHMLTCMMI